MLDRSTRERESEVPPSEMPLSAPATAGAARRPVRSDFARLGPSFAVRRIAAAVVALAVLGGALYVVFGLNGRNQPQEVPVIRADGAYKEKPAAPGGIDIPHQDIQVYQKLDQQGGDVAQAEHLLPQAEIPQKELMPSSPTTFSENAAIEAAHLSPASDNAASSASGHAAVSDASASISERGAAVQSSGGVAGGATHVNETPASADASSFSVSSSIPVATTSSPVAHSGNEVNGSAGFNSTGGAAKTVAVAPATSHVPTSSAQSVDATPPSADKKMAAVLASTVPKVKPQPLPSQPAAPVASSAGGGKRGAVQLASFPDRVVAEQAVDKMQAKYAAYLGGTKLRVVEADLGAKGIYYRIQSQFLSEAQAREICFALKNLKAGCLFVRP
ncbi:MAG: hypothetical protein ABTQ34_07940 [Bdellovibrionales bacterium]